VRLGGKKIGVLLESDYYEQEIWYYASRFPEEGAEVHFLSKLWGQPNLTFTGHGHRVPFECTESFEGMTDDELRSYSALIVPSGMVADRLRWTPDVRTVSEATDLVRRAMAEPGVLTGIICHGMWLLASVPDLVRGRSVTCHNNLFGDVTNMGARYVDADVVVDGDLVTGRTGAHAHLFARKIIDLLAGEQEPSRTGSADAA
jgi:protease I